jgi:peptide chain release factor subunit 1
MNPNDLSVLLLRPRSPEQSVLSVYLHMDPTESADLNRGCAQNLQRMASSMKRSLGRNENARRFDEAVRRLEAYLEESSPAARTVVLFYDATDGFFWHGDLDCAVPNQMRWNHELLLQPLLNATDEQEPYGVVLADRAHLRMFVVGLGRIEEVDRKRWDTKRVRRLKSAGQDHRGSSNVLQRKADERIRANLRLVIPEIEAIAASRNIRRFILAGTRETAGELRKLLPAPLRPFVIGEAVLAMNASSARVRSATEKIAAEYERQTEMEKVQVVMTTSAKGGNAALGLKEGLRAVNTGSVFELIYAEGFRKPGHECMKCSALFLARPTRCPFCAARIHAVSDVVGRAVERAAQAQARIEVVGGDAAAMLETIGGIGALLRAHTNRSALRSNVVTKSSSSAPSKSPERLVVAEGEAP